MTSLSEVANQRLHRETRERPFDRFQPEALHPLSIVPYDYRDSAEALVHKDLRLPFDGNRYCGPHHYVGAEAYHQSRFQRSHHLRSR